MNRIKVAFFDTKSYDEESFNEANKSFNFQITYLHTRLTKETAPIARGHDVACVFVNDKITDEVAQILKDCGVRFIALRCAGYNNIDLRATFDKIHVARVPVYSPHAVAEHALALILSLNRKIHKAYLRTRDNNFTLEGLMGFDLCGKTAGVIGTGQIGKVLINILLGLGLKVLAYDLFPDNVFAQKTGFKYVSLEALYKEADIISLHCPLTKETQHLIDEKAISQMKRGVMIINTGRGKLIDSHALIEGLKTEKVGYAGLDVYEEEDEYFFENFSNTVVTDDTLARLLSFNNVIVTSHQGFFTREALHNIANTTLENIRAFFADGKIPNEICYQCGTAKPCPRDKNGKCFA